MDIVKWAILASTAILGFAFLSVILYILLPFIMGALVGGPNPCAEPQSGAPASTASNLSNAMNNLCSTAKSFFAVISMVLIVLASPIIFVSNAIASFEVFNAQARGGPKLKWLALIWLVPCIGGLGYLFIGRKNFKAA
jgi:hypothetical protein